ncbi:elongation factor EF-2, partial [Candidatus Bathyarchaeota archaeon]|nr:elongation factor EF-2 [Candidatus Bathyarchaeota archaeon]
INKETGEYLLSGMGELHLEIAVKFLKQFSGIDILTSRPIVVYRESVAGKGVLAMAKSPNKHNKFWVEVEPIEENVIKLIEKGDLAEEMGRKRMGNVLKEAGWPTDEARNIWSLDEHRNIIVDRTKGIQYLREAREMINAGFRWACEAGPLCEEPFRGVKIKLMDVKLHEDPVHRGPAQVMPAIRRAILGSFLTAQPVLLEPVYKIGISVAAQWVGDCSSIVTRKRGRILSSEQKGALTMITGHIPVAETFGLSADMRSATSGHAFWQCTFDHWEKAPEKVAAEVIKEIRERRGLRPEIPSPKRFIDEV